MSPETEIKDRKFKTPEELEKYITDLEDKISAHTEEIKKLKEERKEVQSDFDDWFYGVEKDEG